MRRVKGPQRTPTEAPGEAQLDVAFCFEVTAEVWLYEGKGGWHFVSLPVALSDRLKATLGGFSRAWGSLPVVVTLGECRFETSLFPDTKRGCYLLPLSAGVRRRTGVAVGDTVALVVQIVPKSMPRY